MVRDKKYIKNLGMEVSSLGFGTWQWNNIESLRKAIELGITLIDTAEFYGNEDLVGRAIEGFNREELFIVTKVWPNHARYEDTIKAAINSSKRLGTYIDLYLLHWPSEYPICETMKAFEKLVDDGIIRYFGLSNFDVNGIEEARNCLSKYDIAAIENRYSLLHREDEKDVIPYVKKNGMLYLAYTPIEKGILKNEKVLKEVGEKYNKTPIQVVLNWYICIDNLVPIPKANKIEHVIENSGAMGWRLKREDWEYISKSYAI